MEYDEHRILKQVQDLIAVKLYSHDTLLGFIDWVLSITGPSFKAFVLASIIEVLDEADVGKAKLLEAKTRLEE